MNDPLYFAWPFSQIVVERIGWMLVHSLWQFALVALLAGALVQAMRHRSAGMRYGVLVVAMTVSVAAPVATWLLLPSDDPATVANRVENIAPEPDFTAAIDPEPNATRGASDAMLASEEAIELPVPDLAASSVATKTRTALSPEPAAIIETAPPWPDRVEDLVAAVAGVDRSGLEHGSFRLCDSAVARLAHLTAFAAQWECRPCRTKSWPRCSESQIGSVCPARCDCCNRRWLKCRSLSVISGR